MEIEGFIHIVVELQNKLEDEDFELMTKVARNMWLSTNSVIYGEMFSHPTQIKPVIMRAAIFARELRLQKVKLEGDALCWSTNFPLTYIDLLPLLPLSAQSLCTERPLTFSSVSMAASNLMHAVQYDGYGGGSAGLKHVEVPVPTPKKDELLLKLEATSLNPIDWKVQKGIMRPLLPRKFPHIPGTDVAGEVVEVGPGVKSFKAGDKVLANLGIADGGGLAEFAVSKEKLTVARPAEVSAAEAAGLPIAGLTAHQALTQSAGIKLDGSGQQANILITAASGGVGLYAVQLAKLGNTHVTVTCGARNIELVKSLGADEVLDYKTPEGAALKSPSGRKYDFVIHGATGIPWSTFEPNLSEKGKVFDLTPSLSSMATFALKKITFSKKQLLPVFVNVKSENLDYLVKLVKEGKLKTLIDSKHSLSKAEDAWAKSIDGHATGKVIVEPF
ncbi:chloroplast envelope quinone oxidoreductase homolog [Corylus avellana]|uniref:chloroplast envelope quinone oxidoreductase homolog n=1 Tax=Corylus avellana TaxID=13451 RepID=UPI00286A3F3B|nr:chloroplast envelope quinone oxidoreductase homolog [Corylus avellana]